MNQIKLVLVALLSMFSMAAFAADKIVVVNMQEAIQKSEGAKIWMKEFEAEHAADQADIQVLQSEMKAMQERFKKDQAIMSEDEKRKVNKEMQEKYEEYQFKRKKLEKVYQEGQQELLKAMLPKVQEAINRLMEKNNYDMILRREAALTISPKLDITKQVVEQMNSIK